MEQPVIDLEEGNFQAEGSGMLLPVQLLSEEIREHSFRTSGFSLGEESSNARVLPFQLDEGIGGLPPLPTEPCIFRVHKELRPVSPNAYTPLLVSIGPYHHGKKEFHDMEEHKKRYTHLLLKRMNLQGKGLSSEAMKKKLDISKARNYYANSIGDFNEEKLAEMMLLDGCFVIEFLRKYAQPQLREVDDPIFRACWMRIQICRDLMLLENQLPFFVLSQLFDMTETSTYECSQLLRLARIPILQVVPNDYIPSFPPTCETKHFLDLVHKAYLPSASVAAYRGKTGPKISSVTELQEAGVEFINVEGQGREEEVNILDIKFEHGKLKIPKFRVSDSTEMFFRNIIAYEQHSDADHKYFSDYTNLMDLLINSEQDVRKLRRRHIIDNMLGDDKKVADMFNRLGDGRIMDFSDYTYAGLWENVNKHCGKCWNKAKAKLRRDYFNTPWASVSTIAAGLLLILTVTQTVAALITLLN